MDKMDHAVLRQLLIALATKMIYKRIVTMFTDLPEEYDQLLSMIGFFKIGKWDLPNKWFSYIHINDDHAHYQLDLPNFKYDSLKNT